MKRWIHAATSAKLTEEQAANLAKEFLESLGFANVRELKSRDGIGVIFVPFELVEPKLKIPSLEENFRNFKLAQELYNVKPSMIQEMCSSIADDIEKMFIEKLKRKLEVEYHYGYDNLTIYIRTTPFYNMKRPAGAH